MNIKKLFQTTDLTEGSIVKKLILFAIPILLSNLLQQIYTISDAAIVGQTLTAGEVAGVNDCYSLIFMFLQFAFGCCAGFCVITANRFGVDQKDAIRRSLFCQIILVIVLSLLLSLLAIAFLDPLLGVLNITKDSPEVYRSAKTYCTIIFAGVFAQMFYNFICSFLRSLGDSSTPLMFLFLSSVLNIGLDLLFIIVFQMGVGGAAFATVLAQILSGVACLIYAFIKYPYLRLHREDIKFSWTEYANHLKIGLPLGMQFSILAIGIIIMSATIVKFDMLQSVIIASDAQNGFGAATKINNLLMTPLVALNTAITSFVAQNVGAKKYERVKKTTHKALILGAIFCAVVILIGMLSSINGAYLYIFLSPDKINTNTIRYANGFLYMDLAFFIILSYLFVMRGAVQGIEKTKYVLFAGALELVGRFCFCILLPLLLLPEGIDANTKYIYYLVICFCDPCAWIFSSAILSVAYFKFIRPCHYPWIQD